MISKIRKRTQSIVEKRDQRFMFNNKNMKIEKRKRNDIKNEIIKILLLIPVINIKIKVKVIT